MDFIRAIEANLGKKAIIDYQPMQAGDVRKTWAENENIADDYHYRPDHSIEEGIRSFIAWYTSYNPK
jgi:UDP-glucuronate 4-epimerase